MGLESKVLRQQRNERAADQGRADEQREADRDLDGDEHAASAERGGGVQLSAARTPLGADSRSAGSTLNARRPRTP